MPRAGCADASSASAVCACSEPCWNRRPYLRDQPPKRPTLLSALLFQRSLSISAGLFALKFARCAVLVRHPNFRFHFGEVRCTVQASEFMKPIGFCIAAILSFQPAMLAQDQEHSSHDPKMSHDSHNMSSSTNSMKEM